MWHGLAPTIYREAMRSVCSAQHIYHVAFIQKETGNGKIQRHVCHTRSFYKRILLTPVFKLNI